VADRLPRVSQAYFSKIRLLFTCFKKCFKINKNQKMEKQINSSYIRAARAKQQKRNGDMAAEFLSDLKRAFRLCARKTNKEKDLN